jgi:hypothetical protein
MTEYMTYLIFFVLSVVAFSRLPIRPAILFIFIGGWLLLPVGRFPPLQNAGGLPWWITGLAVPSDMLFTKAWAAPAAAFVGAAAFDFRGLRSWRPTPIDLPMALWCLWPLIAGLLTPTSSPSPLTGALYVSGCWGLPWLLGRIWFNSQEERVLLISGLALGGLACLPLAVAESFRAPWIYDVTYGPHPFRLDGVTRYLGYRPLGFFEHGNQYGIWTSLAALAAIWLAAARRLAHDRRALLAIALVTTLIALASQSAGAVILLFTGILVLLAWRHPATRIAMIALVALIALAGALHLSGIVPLRAIAQNTALGQQTIGFFSVLGRRSFLWRMSQDIKVLEIIHQAPLLGTSIWDWWRPLHTRPWGLALLLIGQFGLVGFALAFGSLLLIASLALMRVRKVSGWVPEAAALPLALIILLSLADALLNSFFYFPAVLAAGAIAAARRSTQRNSPAELASH